jgi:hypothetical protein
MAVPKTNTGPPIPLVIDYIDPDGDPTKSYADPVNIGHVWHLSDRTMSNGYTCSAIAGIEGLPVAMQSIPLLDGTSLPLTYLPAIGTIGLAIIVSRPANNDQFAYYTLLDQIVRAFYNRRNEQPAPGTLRITRPDGSQRQVAVYTTSGLNTPEVGVNDATLYSLALSTLDPYWSDVNDTALHFPQTFNNSGILFPSTAQPTAAGITFPSPGIQFNTNLEQSSFVLTNWGDALCYPNWLFTGPGTPTVKNISVTPNRTWALTQSIPAGQQVQVVTAKGHQSCKNVTTGANLWGQLVPNDLFPLFPGDNKVTITVAGATAATVVDVGFTNRWLRA